MNFVPDGRGAYLNSTTDYARIVLPYTIPAGQDYYIIWNPFQSGAQMRIRESLDGSTWSGYKTSAAPAASTLYMLHIEKAGTPTRYIEVSPANGQDFYLDAVVFNVVSCQPGAPDLDVEGLYTYCGSQISIAPGLTITDPANQIINAAYVHVASNYVSGQDRLECTTNYGITANWNATYGVLYLSGQATVCTVSVRSENSDVQKFEVAHLRLVSDRLFFLWKDIIPQPAIITNMLGLRVSDGLLPGWMQ